MPNFKKATYLVLIALLLVACNKPNENALESTNSAADQTEKKPKNDFKTIEWLDLIPQTDLDALLNPPSYISDVEDGSSLDQISSQIRITVTTTNDDPYQQALVSTNIIPEMNKKAIKIPGFIVPLEFNDDQTITQFFLVPFFGACIHVPPPPPNQIIYINNPEGIKIESLYDPFWISGVLKTSLTENELATAAYAMDMHYFEAYTD